MALSPEALHFTGSQPHMERDQARNLVLHGDPNGPAFLDIHIAETATVPAELASSFGQPYVVEKILDKAAPRPALPEVKITMADTTDMSTPEAVAAEFARLKEQLEGQGVGKLFGHGLAQPTEEAVEQMNTNAPRNATLGEEQRAIIYNHLRARTHKWAQELHEGKTPTYFIEEPSHGTTRLVEKPVTQHIIFSLVIAAKTMYEREIASAPTKPLADLARENNFDIFAVENELTKRWQKTQGKKEEVTSEDTENQSVNEENKAEKEARENRIESRTKEREKPREKAPFDEQIVFSLHEVQSILKGPKIPDIPKMDDPNAEAGKRIKAMMEVRL